MKKEDKLTTLDLIKGKALKIERRLEEQQRTYTNGDGSIWVLKHNKSTKSATSHGKMMNLMQLAEGILASTNHRALQAHIMEIKKMLHPKRSALIVAWQTTQQISVTYCKGMWKTLKEWKMTQKINKVDQNNSDDDFSHSSKN